LNRVINIEAVVKTLFLVLVFTLFCGIAGRANAQKISLGAEVSPLLNEGQLIFGGRVYRGFHLQAWRPSVSFGGWLRADFKNNLSLLAGVHWMESGIRTEIRMDHNYPQTKETGDRFTRVMTSEFLVFPVAIQYRHPIFDNKLHVWVRAGSRIHYRRPLTFGAEARIPNLDAAGDTISYAFVFHGDGREPLSLSVQLGLGVEKSFSWGGTISAGITGNRAFKPVGIYDIALEVEGEHYRFQAKSTGNFVAVQIGYFQTIFRLRGNPQTD
jgi:hypothetical protein